MQQNTHKGKVIFVGAGPGDPELLTIKAVRFLRKAEVVLTDRLVSEEVLSEYVSAQAEIISVGKQCRRGASVPQATINELLVHCADQGKLVVRLKGGDVSIFSNILDELQTLVTHGIPYEIVPGITAASGAAAYSGIPLTARSYSTAVRFLTCYKPDAVSEGYWKELSQTEDTLVFYMSAETIGSVVEKLIQNGIPADRHLAVVEQATTPLQNVYTCGIYQYREQWGSRTFLSPSLVIIGKVVALHEQFGWLQNNNSREEYFSPVEGKLISYKDKAERA